MVINSLTRKAVRRHRRPCDYCLREVKKGDTYRTWTWMDRRPIRCKAHESCVKVAARTVHEYDEEYTLGCLQENEEWNLLALAELAMMRSI